MIREISPEYWLRLQSALQAKIREVRNSGSLNYSRPRLVYQKIRQAKGNGQKHQKAFLSAGQGKFIDQLI